MQNRSMKDSKMQRISEEAHKAAKVAAAIEGITLEQWCSQALLKQAKV